MTTKTVVLTSGSSWTLPSDAYGASAQIICIGAGANGAAPVISCVDLSGAGGTSGCIASTSGYTLPSSGAVSIQIPAAGSGSQCWFNSATTVAANSGSTSTTGMAGSTKIAGNAGGAGTPVSCGDPTPGGGGGGGAPGLSTAGSAGTSAGAAGSAGTPSYTATAGGTYGPGAGGAGAVGINNGAPGNNYGAGGGGGALNTSGPCDTYAGTSGGAGAQGLIIVIYTPTGAAVSLPFSYYDFSEHPGAIPRVSPDDTIKNNSGSLQRLLQPQFSPIAFQSNWLVIDPKHPPRSWTLPEFIFPNMVLDNTELEFPNLLIPYDFNRHPPVSWRAPEFIFPQNAQALSVFLFTTPEVMAMRQQIFQQRNPPRSFQFPLPIFPNITLAESKIVTVPFQLWPMDFYRHPPPYYRSVEFMPVNFLAKNIPGIPVTLPATFIRNIQPELDQVRQASPTLTEIRQPGYTLQAIRNFLTKLSK